MKELSQLTGDCTATESLDITKYEFIEINLQEQHCKLVGELQSTITDPVIEITTDKEQPINIQLSRNEQCIIQVKAVVKIKGKTSLNNTKLNLTAYNNGYNTPVTVTVTENTDPNSWKLTFNYSQDNRQGLRSIRPNFIITVNGTYSKPTPVQTIVNDTVIHLQQTLYCNVQFY